MVENVLKGHHIDFYCVVAQRHKDDWCLSATSVGLSQLSSSSSSSPLDAPLSANTTTLATASLTLVTSSTSCGRTKGEDILFHVSQEQRKAKGKP